MRAGCDSIVSEGEISKVLRRIDGRGYKAYKDLAGASELVNGIEVRVTRVQGDPFAPPSVVECRFGKVLPAYFVQDDRLIAVADFLHRRLASLLPKLSLRGVGEGGSGKLSMPHPSPIIIPRSAVEARRKGDVVEFTVRLWAGLPSRRRRILGDDALEMLLERIPKAVSLAVEELSGDNNRLRRHVETWIEQQYIRRTLPKLRLVAFVGDGSILPRKCGGCWEPLDNAVPFESPSSLRVEIELPTGRTIAGMGLPRGLIVIAGPAFHGKTTLAEAIASGVWNHIPGDGRELVVTDESAFYVSSENGRWVSCVDVSSLILSLPGGRSTSCFSTVDASGATSLAASIQEAVEAGAQVIIVDEDEAASNMIHRDHWAEAVTGKRTLNPLSDVAPSMKNEGLSVVIVASGAVPLLAEADSIIVMDEYRARDATNYRFEAKKALKAMGYERGPPYKRPRVRRVVKPLYVEKVKVKGRMIEGKALRDRVDLRPLKQLEEEPQVHTAVRAALAIASKGGVAIAGEAQRLSEMLWKWDYRAITKTPGPDLAYVRPMDIAFVVNRLPGLEASII